MQKEKRYLIKQPSFYESAMQKAKDAGIYNQDTLPEDFYMTVFWCRYIHYSDHPRIRPNSMLHSHSFFELHCVLGGTLAFNNDAGEFKEVSAGEFILIAPGFEHYLKVLSDEAETFALTFEPHCSDSAQGKMLEARLGAVTHIEASIPAEIYELIEQIMNEFHGGKSFCAENVKLLLNITVTDLIRSIFNDASAPSRLPNTGSGYDPRLEEIQKYISDNPARFFKVSELANHLNITTRQLNNLMQSSLGMTTKELIDTKKSEQARKLLLETELSLREISEQLGFSEHNNFNRFFKRMEGLCPGIFRASRGK